MSKNPTPLDRVRDFEREQAMKVSADERPLFHLTPLVGWMNDPNGFCCELFSKGCNSPHLIEHSYTGSSVADGKVAMQGTAA